MGENGDSDAESLAQSLQKVWVSQNRLASLSSFFLFSLIFMNMCYFLVFNRLWFRNPSKLFLLFFICLFLLYGLHFIYKEMVSKFLFVL